VFNFRHKIHQAVVSCKRTATVVVRRRKQRREPESLAVHFLPPFCHVTQTLKYTTNYDTPSRSNSNISIGLARTKIPRQQMAYSGRGKES